MLFTDTTRKVATFDTVFTKSNKVEGIVEGIANVGGRRDLQNDTMAIGCWSRVIASGALPAFCWGHNTADIRGKVTYLEELRPGDPRIRSASGGKAAPQASGLFFRAQMAPTQAGRDAFELLAGGYIKELSVQFSVADGGEESDGRGGRIVKDVLSLYEISAVLKGASEGTGVLSAKAAGGESLAQLFAKAASDVALQMLERRRRRAVMQEVVGEIMPQAMIKVLDAAAEQKARDAEIWKRTGATYWQAPVARKAQPLTEREQFERAIARRAGIY